MTDDRLNFNSHVDYACEKATKAITALTRIMSNSSAISSSKRRLLAGEITRRNLTRLNSTYRLMAMRVASAYRTISMDAVCAIVGMTPINILLEEDCECYRLRGTVGARMIARADSMRKWQLAWDSSSKGRWTYRLIPNLSLWVDRKHGEVNFFLTQFLSVHGYSSICTDSDTQSPPFAQPARTARRHRARVLRLSSIQDRAKCALSRQR
ncbi:uncharacterized protein LOC134204767 [Armigeres subalbatus]|uniref:uncharacterized protein LOC134204767 n=1 Tax=Armigeres subalbatus TaxID=124917 RepID=UPI002ED24BDC